MKAVITLCFVIAVVRGSTIPATTLVRTPSHDSAIIKSDRIGGNFAYSTVEGHAYAAVSPVVQRVSEPVAVSYTAHQVPLGYATAPIAVSQPIIHSVISHQPVLSQHLVAASPVFSSPILAQSPFIPQAPFVAQTPVVGAAPAAPIAPVAPQADPAPAPAPGTVVDDDTVSVEAA